MRWLAAVWLCLGVSACAPQTGLVLEVQGPDGTSSVEAGIVQLRLKVAHHSYCERWVTDTSASTLTVDVAGQDLETDTVSILLTPDQETGGILNYDDEDPDPVRAYVLGFDAGGKLLGVAAFDPVPFFYEEVRKYSQRIVLFRRTDVSYMADDGCLCAPGMATFGNGSGSGCDQELPPSFDRLVDTAGCELPGGATTLPIGACDGQLYPGERQNRQLPCFVREGDVCKAGHRTCNDVDGRAYEGECKPDGGSPALPSGALCDAYLGCEQKACGDPAACMKASTTAHHSLKCVLPVQPTRIDGETVACDGDTWTFSFDGSSGAGCTATMLDGIKQGPVVIGWKKDATTTEPQLTSTLCPPTLIISAVNAKPEELPAQLTFSFSIGDTIYDVTLVPAAGCPDPLTQIGRFKCFAN
jgi:hypothetical protein